MSTDSAVRLRLLGLSCAIASHCLQLKVTGKEAKQLQDGRATNCENPESALQRRRAELKLSLVRQFGKSGTFSPSLGKSALAASFLPRQWRQRTPTGSMAHALSGCSNCKPNGRASRDAASKAPQRRVGRSCRYSLVSGGLHSTLLKCTTNFACG